MPPQLDELTLQEPEIMGKGGKFGVRLRASAPSLHLIRVDIRPRFRRSSARNSSPKKCCGISWRDLSRIRKVWQSNLFGKPLSDLVRKGFPTS